MPRRDNLNLSATPITKDLRNLKAASDSYNKDNVFLTDQGWVYRHYKKADLSQYWDEILVAGEVDLGDAANDPSSAFDTAAPTFEVGDGDKDVEYSPDFSGGGGGAPTPPITIGTITLSGATSVSDGDTETYTATNSGSATGISYSLASSSVGDVVSGMSVTFDGGAGGRTLTVTGTKAGVSDSGATGTLLVTVS